MFLEQIGADARVRELFQPHADGEQVELGRVSAASHEEYRIYLETGEYDATPVSK